MSEPQIHGAVETHSDAAPATGSQALADDCSGQDFFALDTSLRSLSRMGEAEHDEQSARVLRILTPLLKLRACRDNIGVATGAMEVRGGNGYFEEWVEARLVRDAHVGVLWEGTSNINALDVITRAVARDGAHETLATHLGLMLDVQARAVLKHSLSLTSRHAAKMVTGVAGSRSTGKIHSLATFEKYVADLAQAGDWARDAADVRHLRDLTAELAQAYLADRAATGIGQKQLDTDRNALEFLTGKDSFAREVALSAAEMRSRAYAADQVRAVLTCQNPRNALATEIAWRAGLRAHELLNLRRADEAAAAAHRRWIEHRFAGRDGERYVVTGKGGLRREVLISRELAARLENRRHRDPVTVRDRGIVYQRHYDLGGGNAWSKSFGAASARALGWSHGAHGLRHNYAQERMAELQAHGLAYLAAREVVSQELGHFRGDVVEV